jgi:hypothetical protein
MTLSTERLLRAGWAVHAGVGLFNQKGNKFMYGNLEVAPGREGTAEGGP